MKNAFFFLIFRLNNTALSSLIQSSDTLSTPLHEAATVNSLPTVEFLISAGANLTAQNVAGETPFDCTTLLEIRR